MRQDFIGYGFIVGVYGAIPILEHRYPGMSIADQFSLEQDARAIPFLQRRVKRVYVILSE